MQDKEQNNSNQFPKPPKTKVLVKQGYCPDYNETPELAEAYKQFKADDMGGYLLLADFDRDQGRANWVYDKRTGQNLEAQTHTPAEPISHNFPNTPVGREQSIVANLIADGYTHTEIAELLHYSMYRVEQILADIRVIMADTQDDVA